MIGQTDQAIVNLQQAVDFGETSPAVIRDLVELLANAGRYEEADRALKRLREPLLVNSELGRLAAVVAVQRKDTSERLELMKVNRPPEGEKDYREFLWEGRMLAETNNPRRPSRNCARPCGWRTRSRSLTSPWCSSSSDRSATRKPTPCLNRPANGCRPSGSS